MSNRILDVLEAVAVYGPSTLDQLHAKLPRTRSSVYRALIDLEQNGWIRRSLNGRSFSISCKMEKLSDLHFNVSDDLDHVLKTLRQQVKGSKCYLTIACHVRANEFAIIDSSLYPSPRSIDCDEVNHYLSRIINYFRSSGLIIRARVLSEHHNSIDDSSLADFLINGFLFEDELEVGFIPFLLGSGELLMIICRNRDFSPITSREIQQFTRCIFETISKLDVFNFKNVSDQYQSEMHRKAI